MFKRQKPSPGRKKSVNSEKHVTVTMYFLHLLLKYIKEESYLKCSRPAKSATLRAPVRGHQRCGMKIRNKIIQVQRKIRAGVTIPYTEN